MISFFRRSLRSPIALAILGIAIVAFIITGVGNPLGGPPSDTVATVGDENVTSDRLADQFDRTLQTIRQDNPDFTTEQALEEGGLAATLERLIGTVALKEFADRMGLGSSKRLVDAEIARVTAFQGPTGEFSEQTYRQILAQQRIAEADLRRDFRDDVKRRHLLSLVAKLSPTPEGVAEPFALHQLEQRTLNVGAVPYQRFDDLPAPSDEDIEAYYEENVARFTIPERRRFAYVIIDRGDLSEGLTVADEEVAADYEANADLYAPIERRTVRQVVAQSEAQARELTARVRAGENFEAVAADLFELTEEDLALGALTRAEVADVANAAAADAAFAAETGAPTDPVATDFGYNVLIVDDVETTPGRDLAAVRDEIAARLQAEKADEALADLVGRAEDGFADGASLAEVAEDLDLELVRPAPLTAAGRTPDDPAFTLPEEAAPVIETAFDYGAEEDPVAVELSPERFALVDTEEVVAPTPVPLDDIREQVTAQLRAERQIEAGNAMGEEIVAAVKAGSTLAEELRTRGLPPVQDFTRRRIELAAAADQLPAGIMLGFVQPKGELRAVPQPDRGVVLIVETVDIVPGRIEDAPAFLTQVRSQMREAQAQELQLAYTNAITNHVGVTRYPNALAALEARYRGIELTGQ